MTTTAVELHPVESQAQRHAARALVTEYLQWVADVARSSYDLSFDVDAMVRSDMDDPSKFFPPTGRFYLVHYGGSYVGVGCLKRLAPEVGEIQRMYVQPRVRGVGAGRILVGRLLEDAKALGYKKIRLESLKALTAAHSLYRSVGFREIGAYSGSGMKAYQPPENLGAYSDSVLFMEIVFGDPAGDAEPLAAPDPAT